VSLEEVPHGRVQGCVPGVVELVEYGSAGIRAGCGEPQTDVCGSLLRLLDRRCYQGLDHGDTGRVELIVGQRKYRRCEVPTLAPPLVALSRMGYVVASDRRILLR
jgi:hypothetical protein